jgi:hypothetical protein
MLSFHYYHHHTLFFILSFLEEIARVHEEAIGGVMKSREDVLAWCAILVRY